MPTSRSATVPAVKDLDRQQPVPSAWRSTLAAIVQAIASGDFALRKGVPCVGVLAPATAQQVKEYIADYGETLAALPKESWDSSVVQWMDGHWDVLVDLWTVESGECDLALAVRVFEDGDSFRFEVDGVHVP